MRTKKIELYKLLEFVNDEHDRVRWLLERCESKEEESQLIGQLDEIRRFRDYLLKEYK